METKREAFERIVKGFTTNPGEINQYMADYDNAADDKPITTELTSEQLQPNVHEIAMHLAAAVIARGVIDQADPKFVYKVAQELYDAGTEWEQGKEPINKNNPADELPIRILDEIEKKNLRSVAIVWDKDESCWDWGTAGTVQKCRRDFFTHHIDIDDVVEFLNKHVGDPNKEDD